MTPIQSLRLKYQMMRPTTLCASLIPAVICKPKWKTSRSLCAAHANLTDEASSEVQKSLSKKQKRNRESPPFCKQSPLLSHVAVGDFGIRQLIRLKATAYTVSGTSHLQCIDDRNQERTSIDHPSQPSRRPIISPHTNRYLALGALTISKTAAATIAANRGASLNATHRSGP